MSDSVPSVFKVNKKKSEPECTEVTVLEEPEIALWIIRWNLQVSTQSFYSSINCISTRIKTAVTSHIWDVLACCTYIILLFES